MRFETAREVIEHASNFHSELSDFYKTLAAEHKTDKTKLLLDYLTQHELELADAISRYKSDTSAGILDTWFQFTQEQDILKIAQHDALCGEASTDDITAFFMSVGDQLITLYKEMASQADEPDLKNVFTNLIDMQTREHRKFTMNVDRMMDW
ncbi:MAG: hypothetical protein AAGJ37_07395 [Pseudomonadota bacterium]